MRNKINEIELMTSFKEKLASLQEYRKKELTSSAISKHAEEKLDPASFLISEEAAQVDPTSQALDSSIESMADDACPNCKEMVCKCSDGYTKKTVSMDKVTSDVLKKLSKLNKKLHKAGNTLAADVVEVTARKIYRKAAAQYNKKMKKIASLRGVSNEARQSGNHFAADLIDATINKIASHEFETPDYEVPADWVAGADLDLPARPSKATSFEGIEPAPFGSPENPLEVGDRGVWKDSGEGALIEDALNVSDFVGKQIDEVPEEFDWDSEINEMLNSEDLVKTQEEWSEDDDTDNDMDMW